ncbi:peptidase S8/S53 domain-containing protein [Pilobolus umbonatus]|nr:peptidase S8/S53 domain-containing protein [Pilobolus umbonatus]
MKLFSVLLYFLLLSAIHCKNSGKQYIVVFNHHINTTIINSFKSALSHIDFSILDTYEHDLLSGLYINLKTPPHERSQALSYINNYPGVKYIQPVNKLQAASIQSQSTQSNLDYSLLNPSRMVQIDKTYEHFEERGEGVLVCILDTGVDYLHPALGGGFGKGFKVSIGYDLVGDQFDGDDYIVPDDDPMDSCSDEGHGTHISGIIAGYDKSKNFSGVVPNALLGHYRVLGCLGLTNDAIVAKALLMAYDDGCNVINISLSRYGSYDTVVYNDIIDRLIEKGVPVIASAGNSGSEGYTSVTAPGSNLDVIAVASVENNNIIQKVFEATGVRDKINYWDAENETNFFQGGTLVLGDLYPGSGTEACDINTVPSSVKHKIGLVQRGNCTFDEKIGNLVSKGAVGALIYNNDNSLLIIGLKEDMIPHASISLDSGIALWKALNTTTVNIDNLGLAIEKYSMGSTIADYSSIGPDPELFLKPNLAAVGQDIYSTVPQRLGSYGVYFGTSMAAAYTSGMVALYMSIKGTNHSVPFITTQIMNSAKPISTKDLQMTDSPVRQGAGLVQIYDSIIQTSQVSPSFISFNDTSTYDYLTQQLTITNYGSNRVKYRLHHHISTGISPYDYPQSGYYPLSTLDYEASALITFSKTFFSLLPGASCTINVTVTPPNTIPDDHIVYGGYIGVQTIEDTVDRNMTVPYFGIVGSQKNLTLFSDPAIMTDRDDNTYYKSTDSIRLDPSDEDSSVKVVAKLMNPSPRIKFEVRDVETQQIIGRFLEDVYRVGRSLDSLDTYYDTYEWDGTILSADSDPRLAPPGNYTLRLSALRMFGDPDKESDWESVELTNIIRIG